jgi:hypothetical protein
MMAESSVSHSYRKSQPFLSKELLVAKTTVQRSRSKTKWKGIGAWRDGNDWASQGGFHDLRMATEKRWPHCTVVPHPDFVFFFFFHFSFIIHMCIQGLIWWVRPGM